jgi:hypothetical protein
MLRVVIFVVAIVGIFAGTLVYGGERLGAWDEASPPPPSNLAPITRSDKKKDKGGSASALAGGGGSTPTKLSPAKARWIRQTNALCRRASEDMSDYDEPETLGEAEKLIAELKGKNEHYNKAFAAIVPAKEDRRAVATLLKLFAKDERLVAALLDALRAGDAGAMLELNDRLTALAQQESDILVALGATDCSVGLVAPAY